MDFYQIEFDLSAFKLYDKNQKSEIFNLGIEYRIQETIHFPSETLGQFEILEASHMGVAAIIQQLRISYSDLKGCWIWGLKLKL